jgi:hypothetical protein
MGEKGRPWGLPFWFGGSRERLWRAAVGRGFRWDRRRSRPAAWFPARLRAGARLSPEKAGGKSAGGVAPWTPFFMARSFSLAGFGVVGRSVPVDGLLRNPWTCPDLETFFRKMLSSIFSLENASQIGLGIPEETAPLSYQRQRSPKRANGSERAMNPGVQGLAPGVLSPDFLPKKVGLPRRSRRGTHVAGSTLQRFQRNRLSMTEGPRALTSDRDGPAPRWPGPPGPRRPPPGPGPG